MKAKPEQATLQRKWFPFTIEFTIWFLMTGAVGVCLYEIVSYLQKLGCPLNSYVVGSGKLAAIFVVLPLLFASLVPGLLLSNAVTGVTAGTRRFFDGDADHRTGVSFRYSKRFRRKFSIISVYIAPVLIPLLISTTSSFSEFCLAPDRIVSRTYPWSLPKSHRWDDVRKITTSCQRAAKNSWEPGFILEFDDGFSIDVMGGTGPTWKHGGDIHRSLSGKRFDFDNSGVDPRCGVANPQMLTERP
ncbi:MAG TPA: hypothetical protein VK533_08220 [Sphingomonas sp.]|uniref:hypothetical protein n=1 Tax=Sphingomonas sp. TaxID=28214 RepID=UPI002BC000BE|nr:hypothetical protein [Sphingomonas sp.]HMI19513.1 hypothetical protein [Sphingomonas sp.]